MSFMEPRYLVQTADGTLHAYYTPIILAISLADNKGEQVTLFKVQKFMGSRRYVPCTAEDVRADVDADKAAS